MMVISDLFYSVYFMGRITREMFTKKFFLLSPLLLLLLLPCLLSPSPSPSPLSLVIFESKRFVDLKNHKHCFGRKTNHRAKDISSLLFVMFYSEIDQIRKFLSSTKRVIISNRELICPLTEGVLKPSKSRTIFELLTLRPMWTTKTKLSDFKTNE